MRILLAEDAALMRDGLVALLTRAGHEVVDAVATAPELEARVRDLAENLPDLVLADVRMPPDNADDGLRAGVRIRQRHPRLPVVLLSQYLGHDYLKRLLDSVRDHPDAGGVGYLLKDRVAHVADFMTALKTVAAGGVVVDQKVMDTLRERPTGRLDVLTGREAEVLRLVATGATNPQVGSAMHLSEGAVVKHLSAIFDKLGLNSEGNRRVLAVLAYLEGSRTSQ